MFAPISFTLNPFIVLINVFAFAVGVPVVVSSASYSLKKLISFFSKKLLAPVAAVVEV